MGDVPAKQKTRAAAPVLALVAVTAVWGSTFFLIKDLVEQMPPLDFLGVRFALAGLIIAALQWKKLLKATRQEWAYGGALGGVYSIGQAAQTIGLEHTAASVSGFITGTYVILTPILAALLFRDRIRGRVWIAVLLATVGLAFLSLDGLPFFGNEGARPPSLPVPIFGSGEALTLFGSVFYALHIVLVGRWSKKTDPLTLGTIQLMSAGVLLGTSAVPGGIVLPQTTGAWVSFLYMTLVAGIGAVMVQTWAQAKMHSTTAAVIMTGEPLFAAAFAILFGGEHFGLRLAVGGMLVLGAMIVVESGSGGNRRWKRRRQLSGRHSP